VLGDGPFGPIYKAEHATVGRHVALRVLPAALLEQPQVLHRFFREARLMSAVDSPRLQPLVDAGLSPEGVAYVAYEYVRGRSLASALATDAPIPLPLSATIVCDVLEGLAAIHHTGLVHRALSPESVLLRMSQSGFEHALLTNFGAAALQPGSGAEALESARDAAATPLVNVPAPYVPPERRAGAPPDLREDIYAAGMMLAGCLSPRGRVRLGSALIAENVPPPIEAIVARAVQPSPSARFATAGEMLEHLMPYAVRDDEDPGIVTQTHISDLRALSRREKALGRVGREARVQAASHEGAVLVDAELAAIMIRALSSAASVGWTELARRMPDVVATLARATANAQPVPLALLGAAFEEADALVGANDRLLCTVMGERAARDDLLRAVEGEFGRVTPELFFDQVVVSWAHRLTRGVCRTTSVGRGYGRLEIRTQREPILAVCSFFTGALTEAVAKLGGRNVEVSKTACEAVGDPACIFSATWL
jgi:serine/threonine-protein kinase